MTFQWLPSSALVAAAVVVSVAGSEPEFTIDGIVRSSAGGPLPSVRVTLTTDSAKPVQDVAAGEDGRFTFRQVQRGRYLVAATKPGFVEARFGATHLADAGTPIVVGEAAVPDIVIALEPGAVIEGEVQGPAGEPAPNAGVVAVRATVNPWTGVRVYAPATDERQTFRGIADGRGRFRLYGVPAGAYVVVATWLRPRTGWVRGYYPSASTVADADLVVVSPAATAEASIRLRESSAPRLTVSGVVQGPAAVLNGTRLFVDIERPDEPFVNEASIGSDGSFSFAGLPPGRYVLQARTPARSTEAGPSRWWAQNAIELAGNDASGVALILQPGVAIIGRITLDGGSQRPPLAGSKVALQSLYPWQRDEPIAAALDESGRFRFVAVAPGRYKLSITWPGTLLARFGFRQLIVNGTETLPSRVVLPPTASENTLTLLLTELSPKVTGIIRGIGTQAIPEITVLLIPTAAHLWDADPARTRVTRAATDATFQFDDVMPGEYFLAVVRRPDFDFVREPGFLQTVVSHGVRLTVAPGERRHVELQGG